jgi:serine/threonine protein kinase
VFATLYINGHLVTAAFAAAMALAFAMSAARVPDHRSDLWFTVAFLCTGTAGIIEMTLCVMPSLLLARTHLVAGASVLLSVCIGCHAQYVSDVADPALRRRYRWFVVAYAGFTAAMIAIVYSGFMDGGHTRVISRWGVEATMSVVRPVGVFLQFIYTCTQTAILLPMLLAPGERRAERMLLAGPIVLVPLVGIYEQLICLGVSNLLPLSGYYSAAAALMGAAVLAERFRVLSRGLSVMGEYAIERRLGGGGMADVYLARRAGDGKLSKVVRRVALKRMRPEYVGDPAFVQMFLDEARIVARLSHPHIVALHDVGREHGELYLVMELVEGAPLSRVLNVLRARGEVFDTDVAVELALQLSDALAYAHELTDDDGRPLELVHRDVSPQNILLTPTGHLKLADFGIARSADRVQQTATGVIKGKTAYMAPEQLKGERYDHRADLYAAGVVMFEMVTGARPFEGESDAAVLYRVLRGEMHIGNRLIVAPEPLVGLIRSMLDPEPTQRPASAAEVHRTLASMHTDSAREKLRRLVAMAVENQIRDHSQPYETVAAKRLD